MLGARGRSLCRQPCHREEPAGRGRLGGTRPAWRMSPSGTPVRRFVRRGARRARLCRRGRRGRGGRRRDRRRRGRGRAGGQHCTRRSRGRRGGGRGPTMRPRFGRSTLRGGRSPLHRGGSAFLGGRAPFLGRRSPSFATEFLRLTAPGALLLRRRRGRGRRHRRSPFLLRRFRCAAAMVCTWRAAVNPSVRWLGSAPPIPRRRVRARL
jgi:hypothetical protein